MRQDIQVEEKICDVKDKLDTLAGEKAKIDQINSGIDSRLEAFHKKYENQLKEFEEIGMKDGGIEEKYILLKDELEQVSSERQNIIKKNELLDEEIIEIKN